MRPVSDGLVCDGLVVRFGDITALDGADLVVPVGDVTALIGPSGCGKSTLLRVVAGLQPLDGGAVTWQGGDLASVPTHRRRFGLMFQDFALFPHRTVGGNVAFGLRMAGRPAAEIASRVAEVLDLVGLGGAAGRGVDELSGGEQQRVALARTLAPRPDLVMLDEPVASLDRSLRERLVVEMREIFTGLGVTVVYVTHDQAEAFGIADHVAVMDAGRIVRHGDPASVWSDPGSESVARFLGHDAIVDLTVAGGRARIGDLVVPVTLADGAHRVIVPTTAVRLDLRDGDLEDGAGPDDHTTGSRRSPGHGTGTARHVSYRGGRYRIIVDVGGLDVTAETTGPPPTAGTEVGVAIDPRGLILLTD